MSDRGAYTPSRSPTKVRSPLVQRTLVTPHKGKKSSCTLCSRRRRQIPRLLRL